MDGTVAWGKFLRFEVVIIGLTVCGALGSGAKVVGYEGMPFAATLLRCSW